MSRVIKFRYTCVRKNGFVFSRVFTLDEIETGSVIQWDKANITATGIVYKDLFTGLLDKNGKEIYEGDFVRLSEDFHFKEFEVCVIEYHKHGIPYIVQRYLKNDPNTGDYNFDYMKDSRLSGVESYYEVIGNIYENSEIFPPTIPL